MINKKIVLPKNFLKEVNQFSQIIQSSRDETIKTWTDETYEKSVKWAVKKKNTTTKT